jgi:hypothetical protein
MNKFEDKSNNEILLEMKQLELDHEALKQKMLKDYDKLMEIEESHAEANKVINKRLKKDK